ncbi:MAK10-like protein [Tanacetum coccineum]
MGDENPIRTLGDYSKPSHEGYRNTIELPVKNNVERTRLHLFQFSFRDQASNWLERLPTGSITTWEDLTTRFLAQFFPPGRTAKLHNDILIGPHDTQYCMEDPKKAFVEYVSSRTDEAGAHSKEVNISQASLLQTEMGIELQQPEEPEPTLEDEFQDFHLNLSVLEVLAHALIYNAILDKYVESLELGKNGSAFVQGEVPAKMEDPGLFTLPCKLRDSKPFDTLANLGSCVNIIPLYLFKKLNIGLLEETNHIFGLADGTKSYPVGIVKDVEVYIGKLKLLNDFYVIDMKKMAKIAVGEGITRSVFGVKGVNLGEEEAPYWTTLGKRESYKPRPRSDGVGARTSYYTRKDFLDCHSPEEWEIARDAELNPFKDTLVFRRMVEFLGAISSNM